jgi:DNA helicase-2/ATP-dependent DNA helicase PcrA
MLYADLHVHSRFSRATSRDCDLEHLAFWAGKKGISVVGTGDFTHPGWFEEIQSKLAPAEPGLYRLRPEVEKEVAERLGRAAPNHVRFMLQVEISTIYKKDGRTRKVHHLVYAPEIEHARRLSQSLARIGNIASDGRPILGLDSRNLLEIVLESGEGCYLVPAHIWTPWFAVLGSQSGFDSIEHCYGDLSGEVFALETGLSSDPAMNWRLSALDRYALVSNSDAHSPPKLGREACAFDTEPDYFAMRRALQTGEGYCGTVEFFPEEGKYHFDGHRKCGVCWPPEETRRHGGKCPVCGKPVTVGVMYRVCELADRTEAAAAAPQRAAPFRSLIPLEEILAEVHGVGAQSNTVQRKYEELIAQLGPELFILDSVPGKTSPGPRRRCWLRPWPGCGMAGSFARRASTASMA